MNSDQKITCTNIWKLFGPDEKRTIKNLIKLYKKLPILIFLPKILNCTVFNSVISDLLLKLKSKIGIIKLFIIENATSVTNEDITVPIIIAYNLFSSKK